MSRRTPVTLVTGGTVGEREAAIADLIANLDMASLSDSPQTIGIILEGLADGTNHFAEFAGNSHFPSLTISRIAPGCPCCIGNLTMRVTLNRVLRKAPDQLYLSLSSSSHLEQVRSFLMQPPYNNLIELSKDLSI
jgi:hypothetical protein